MILLPITSARLNCNFANATRCGRRSKPFACIEQVGEALVGYYKMFLNVFNLFMNCTKNTGDRMDYGQR